MEEKELLEIFAGRLKDCRESAGLTKKDLAPLVGTSIGNISRYESAMHGAGRDVLLNMAKVFGVSPSWLMGMDVPKYEEKTIKSISVYKELVAGVPVEGQSEVDLMPVASSSAADFGYIMTGDSMAGACIKDGDTVLIHRQSEVENGDIILVEVHGEVLLRRYYYEDGRIMLLSENPGVLPIIINDMKKFKIIGKAIYSLGKVR